MFIPVQVQPEIGQFAAGFPYPYLENNQVQTAYVQGAITKVDTDEKQILIYGFKEWIPFHRISVFTFGGIEIQNTDYDVEEHWKEDRRVIDKIAGKIIKGH